MNRAQFALVLGAAVALGATAGALQRRIPGLDSPSGTQADEVSRALVRATVAIRVDWTDTDDRAHGIYLVKRGTGLSIERIVYEQTIDHIASGAQIIALVSRKDDTDEAVAMRHAAVVIATLWQNDDLDPVLASERLPPGYLTEIQNSIRHERNYNEWNDTVDIARPIPLQLEFAREKGSSDTEYTLLNGYKATEGRRLNMTTAILSWDGADKQVLILARPTTALALLDRIGGDATLRGYGGSLHRPRSGGPWTMALPPDDPRFIDILGPAHDVEDCAQMLMQMNDEIWNNARMGRMRDPAAPVEADTWQSDPHHYYLQRANRLLLRSVLDHTHADDLIDEYLDGVWPPKAPPTPEEAERFNNSLARNLQLVPYDQTLDPTDTLRRVLWRIALHPGQLIPSLSRTNQLEYVRDMCDNAQVALNATTDVVTIALILSHVQMLRRWYFETSTAWGGEPAEVYDAVFGDFIPRANPQIAQSHEPLLPRQQSGGVVTYNDAVILREVTPINVPPNTVPDRVDLRQYVLELRHDRRYTWEGVTFAVMQRATRVAWRGGPGGSVAMSMPALTDMVGLPERDWRPWSSVDTGQVALLPKTSEAVIRRASLIPEFVPG